MEIDLEAQSCLVDQIAQRLLDASIVLLRGPRQSGKSRIARLVCERLKLVTDSTPRLLDGAPGLDTELDRDLRSDVASYGHASVIIDDLGGLLRTTPGRALHARLTSLCVDGREASSIGVLITCVVGENVSRPGTHGSPLADRADIEYCVPVVGVADLVDGASRIGIDAARMLAAVKLYGGNFPLLVECLSSAGGAVTSVSEQHAILSSVGTMTASGAARVLALARQLNRGLALVGNDQEIAPLVYSEDGRTFIGSRYVALDFGSLLIGSSQSWPSSLEAAVRRFLSRIYGFAESLWFDRYLGARLVAFKEFLEALYDKGYRGQLKLLGTPLGVKGISAADKAAFASACHRWTAGGMSISWRLVAPADIRALHDRQLISSGRLDGYSLPPVDRVICAEAPGNEVDAHIPLAPASLLRSAWDRAGPYL